VIPTSKSKGLDGYTRCACASNWIDDMLEKSISSEESAEDAATYLLINLAKNIQKHLKRQGSSLGILVYGMNQWMQRQLLVCGPKQIY
jgi:hypothetical protein